MERGIPQILSTRQWFNEFIFLKIQLARPFGVGRGAQFKQVVRDRPVQRGKENSMKCPHYERTKKRWKEIDQIKTSKWREKTEGRRTKKRRKLEKNRI